MTYGNIIDLFKNRQNSSVKRYASVTAVTLLIAGVAYGTFLRANYWASESVKLLFCFFQVHCAVSS
jgi:hypothetical protein